jgi:hypothetical protein
MLGVLPLSPLINISLQTSILQRLTLNKGTGRVNALSVFDS